MTRLAILIALLGATLLGAGGWWFATHFERVPVKTQQPPGPEAMRNPYLALERFMTRMGRSVTRTSEARMLDAMAPGGVLILDRNRRALMTRARVDALFNWVGRGGYLIVVPEGLNMPDPVLAYLHVKWEYGKSESCGCSKPASAPQAARPPAPASAPEAARPAAVPMSTLKSARTPEPLAVRIPGDDNALTIAHQYAGLKAGDIDPECRVARASDSDWLLHYRYGLGNISLIVNLDGVLSNKSIGQFDHAELFWKLLQRYQPNGRVILMTHIPLPSLFDWLAENAWAALISAAAVIALLLWRAVPRFGAARPDLPPARREMREHLNAVGRFVWRTEGFARWLEAARTSLRERLVVRHPAIAAMPVPDQAEALSKLTSRPATLIESALAGTARNASEFTAMLRTLKNLKHDL